MNKDFHAKKPKIKLTVIFKACTCKTDKGDKINFKNSCENVLSNYICHILTNIMSILLLNYHL